MKLNHVHLSMPDHVPPELVAESPLAGRRTILENPFETIIPEIHKGPPVIMASNGYYGTPAWVFRRADDIKKIFTDTRNFIKKGNTSFSAMIGEEWDVIPTELDAPRHTAVRKALNPFFTPQAVMQFEGKVRSRAREYIATFKDRGHCDFVRDFAVPYPVSIFLDLLGLPMDRMEEFLEWEYALVHASDMNHQAAGVRAVVKYLREAIDERRERPTDDLISNALALDVDGGKFSPDEVLGHCFNLFIGGLDTVSANLGLHFMHLAQNQDDQARLRREPELIQRAMFEMLRAYPLTLHQRICSNDVEVGGVQVKAGDRVVIVLALAGRDPERYENPNLVDFDRASPANLTFGFGVHRCLGVELAQRELLFALQEMLAEVPQFRLKPGFTIPFRVGSVIQASALELEWDA